MDVRRIPWHGRLAVLLLVPSILALTGCGSDSSDDNSTSGSTATASSTGTAGADAQVCSDLKDVRASISDLKNVPLTKDGLSSLSTKLDQINTQVHELADAAKGSAKPQIDALSASVETLKTDVKAAISNPSGTTLSALPSALVAVGTAAQSVSSALPDC